MRRTKSDQWSQELREVRDPAALFGGSAQTAVLRLLTMAGKVPFRSAFDSLTLRERAIVGHLLGRQELRLTAPGADPSPAGFVLAHSSLGKLTVHEPARGDLPTGEVVAELALPGWLVEMIDEECLPAQAEEEHQRHELDQMLHTWHADGSLPARLEEVVDWVERVETVLIYVERRVFSRSDSGSSTLIRDGVLPALRGRAPADWSPQERLFVAAVQLLFRTGRAVRFEEFNGRQLSAVSLRRTLTTRCATYLRALDEPVTGQLGTATLAELAALAGDLVERVDGGGDLRYRRVNGLTYAKDEYLLPWEPDRRSQAVLPRTLHALTDACPEPADGEDAAAWVRRATAAALRTAHDSGDEGDLNRILEGIVLGAVVDGRADYGMSSGVRDLSRLNGLAGEYGEEVAGLKKPDFFCCVLPSPEMAADLPAAAVTDILWQVAQRMMYNRWHFVPGNFDRVAVPRQRHYFFPPLVPDIGEWGDLRHGGHSTARVRYTLRAPGAAMWKQPFTVGGRQYRGAYDIRLVRMDGPPFTLDDLRVACRYSALVDVFWREIASYADAHGGWSPTIGSFGGDWYASQAWRAPVDRLAVVGEPVGGLV
ncbi:MULTISPECIES: hypothetical protein [Micromonospora]|uniref:Uncharacterized protein n=1 Tax=Micromonospora yangpuensis TaxID=683228 RepID=A0A1C6ULT0_9ACTN|nr:hypothetical protein [Micromonospora yangpuensis]GGM17775.1 hypothetical protein GCM10012279_39900 [Micromonospora yangpuensis]SCL54833.1 hypothetical protein GA0070617_2782 [Micromonospora yangpuensis]